MSKIFLKDLARVIADQIDPLHARVSKLEKEMAAREYKGVYSGMASYRRHNSVTHHGSVWIATEEPRGSPPGNGWTLAVKRGRQGKDS